MLLSKALDVDVTELLSPAAREASPQHGGRRVVVRAGEGHLVETHSYRQLYLATELLNKRFTPMVVELCARTIEEFIAEFGGLIRHPGEEFMQVLEGEVGFHSELYAPCAIERGRFGLLRQRNGTCLHQGIGGPLSHRSYLWLLKRPDGCLEMRPNLTTLSGVWSIE